MFGTGLDIVALLTWLITAIVIVSVVALMLRALLSYRRRHSQESSKARRGPIE